MKKPVLRQVIQLSFGQYVEVWSGLIFEHYQIGMSDDVLFQQLALEGDAQARFSVEYSAVLMTVAALSLGAKPNLTSEKNKERLIDQMAEASYQLIMPDADEETIDGCVRFFRSKLAIFSRICSNIAGKKAEARTRDLAGLSRYLAAQVSEREEEQNRQAIERIGVLLSDACECFIKLVTNSVQDAMRLDGKPSFSVQRD